MKYFFCLFILSITLIHAQKTQFDKKKIEFEFSQPESFKGLKTYSYEVQNSGLYNKSDEKSENIKDDKIITSLAEDLKIKGLDKVESNGDIKIVVSFISSKFKKNNGVLVLEGTMNLLLFLKKDKLYFNDIINVSELIKSNLESYPITNSSEKNKSIVKVITGLVQKYIDNIDFLFTGKSEIELSFGSFKKTKNEQTKFFNDKSLPIAAQLTEESNVQELNKAKIFWKEQLDTDFGEKVKEKHKLRIIYVNLASAFALSGDKNEAKEFYDLANENSGFFEILNEGVKGFVKKKELESLFLTHFAK